TLAPERFAARCASYSTSRAVAMARLNAGRSDFQAVCLPHLRLRITSLSTAHLLLRRRDRRSCTRRPSPPRPTPGPPLRLRASGTTQGPALRTRAPPPASLALPSGARGLPPA